MSQSNNNNNIKKYNFQCMVGEKRFFLESISSDETIEHLQQKIEQKTGLSVKRQKLMMGSPLHELSNFNSNKKIGELSLNDQTQNEIIISDNHSNSNSNHNGDMSSDNDWIVVDENNNNNNNNHNNNNNQSNNSQFVILEPQKSHGSDMSLDSNMEDKSQPQSEPQQQPQPQPQQPPQQAQENNNNNKEEKDEKDEKEMLEHLSKIINEEEDAKQIQQQILKQEEEDKMNEEEYHEYLKRFNNYIIEDESKINGSLISENMIQDLKLLLWGNNYKPVDMNRWHSQGLQFIDDDKMRFGLIQLFGGPCGVLAPIQGLVLKELLFNNLEIFKEDDAEIPLICDNDVRQIALIRALQTIMIQCASQKNHYEWIIYISPNNHDHVWSKIVYNEQDLYNIIQNTLPLLESKLGIVAFVFSVLLTRSINKIKSEMDDYTQPLVLEQFGHCSQEIVNLMLTGCAVTNVHDGDKILGDPNDPHAFKLHGINPDPIIGFLSTLEVMQYTKVGDNYKTPKYPIWVIGSSSHYSILFALNINIGKISAKEKQEQITKQKFNQFDPEENGFIAFDKLSDLFKLLNINNIKPNDIRNLVDPSNSGVIIWQDFISAVKRIQEQENMNWECNSCTFHNPMNQNQCDVCGSNRNNNSKLVFANDMNNNNQNINNENHPKTFTMYHFNGLVSHKKDKAQLTKLKVFDEQEMDIPPMGLAEEFSGLIRTKWPYAVVEYAGPFQPKIQ